MDSIIDWIWQEYFLRAKGESEFARIAEICKRQINEKCGPFLSRAKEMDETMYQEMTQVFDRVAGDQACERSEMFALGFSLGAKLMVEVFTTQ